eukprot:NODE_1064_length_2363_cov_0.224823.p1 type:complete len:139 gc:universal NODE_1064_length_2363_cov_0.224823:1806-2222(+)
MLLFNFKLYLFILFISFFCHSFSTLLTILIMIFTIIQTQSMTSDTTSTTLVPLCCKHWRVAFNAKYINLFYINCSMLIHDFKHLKMFMNIYIKTEYPFPPPLIPQHHLLLNQLHKFHSPLLHCHQYHTEYQSVLVVQY